MASFYPTGILPYPSTPVVDGNTIYADHVWRLYDELSGIETYLGLNAQGNYVSVRDRISGLETGYLKSYSDVGGGTSLVNSMSTGTLNFRTLAGGSGIGITQGGGLITISATGVSGASFTGGAILSSITPTSSGTLGMGSSSLPFATGYFKQYATTLTSGTGATQTVNWDNGTSQILNFIGVASGTYTLTLSGGIPGSAYVLETIQNAGGTASVLWSSNIAWQGGVSGVMTATSGTKDLYSFWFDGAKYLGSYSNNFY